MKIATGVVHLWKPLKNAAFPAWGCAISRPPAPPPVSYTHLDVYKRQPLLYIQAPQKASNDALPTGVTDYGNGYADSLLSVLAENGVDYLDLRPGMEAAAAQPDAPAFFFRTDHHWTPEGGFAGYQILSRYLDEHYGMEAPALFTDPDSYEKLVYEDYFLGSQGKRVGTLYAGTDDITLWKPKFETSFTSSCRLYTSRCV